MTVSEVEHAGQLQALLFVDIDAKEEFPLQLSDLVLGVWAALFAGALATYGAVKEGGELTWILQSTPEP